MIEPINLELITEAKEHLASMQSICDKFKGDKTPLKARISVFKRLYEGYKSKCIDETLASAENEKTQVALMTKVLELNAKERSLNDRQKFIEEWGAELSDQNLTKLAELIRQ